MGTLFWPLLYLKLTLSKAESFIVRNGDLWQLAFVLSCPFFFDLVKRIELVLEKLA